jgi:HAD superfamily hydrolase (TIGR01509 family)
VTPAPIGPALPIVPALIVPALIVFDCDGVLVDSEPVASRVTARLLTALGWPMTDAEANARFLGMALPDMCPVIEARIGKLPADFERQLSAALIAALSREALPIAGAAEVLRALAASGVPVRVASNSSRAEMAAKFAATGLASLVAGRLHSFEDVLAAGGRGKPAPDLYLAAAAAEGVRPADCLVIEDSVPGVQAAVAAGMACLGFAPSDGMGLDAPSDAPLHAGGTDASALLAAGASCVLRALPDLLALPELRALGSAA